MGLAVGIENYQDESLKLAYAIEDVKAFKQTLERQGRQLYREVRIDILPDATYEEIRAAFTEAQDHMRVGADDVFVLYLSGHGVTDNGNYHFLTQNFIWTSPKALEHNTIDSNSLNAFMAGIQARKAVLFLDTCYAGSYKPDITASQALFLAAKAGPEDKQAIGRMAEATAVERLNQLSGRAVFYASTSRDVALEGFNRHGLYTALLLEGLRGKASPDDSYVSLHELSSYLEKRMPEESKRLFNIRLYPMAHVPTSFNLTTRQDTP